jgi:PhnB protein
MANDAKPVPERFHTITPSLTCRGAGRAIEFYMDALGATELVRMNAPDGKVMHAELKIGDSIFFLSEDFGQAAPQSSSAANPGIYLYVYVKDADSVFNRAVAAGARVDMPVQDMFWGDRYGKLTDPFGHSWGIATHLEDIAPDEMERRAAAFFAKAAGQG